MLQSSLVVFTSSLSSHFGHFYESFFSYTFNKSKNRRFQTTIKCPPPLPSAGLSTPRKADQKSHRSPNFVFKRKMCLVHVGQLQESLITDEGIENVTALVGIITLNAQFSIVKLCGYLLYKFIHVDIYLVHMHV